jgi:hypothetical protein
LLESPSSAEPLLLGKLASPYVSKYLAIIFITNSFAFFCLEKTKKQNINYKSRSKQIKFFVLPYHVNM